MTTIWQTNADTFASRPETYIDQKRRSGVREALGYILDGQPGRAQFTLARSVQRQARIAGLGTLPVPMCACGGRCTHVEVGGAR